MNNRKGNKNYRNKKFERKPKDKDTPKKVGNDKRLSSLNDISWYNRFPELLDAAGKLPFAKLPGMVLNLNKVGSAATPSGMKTLTTNDHTMPGFMSIDWLPSVGYSEDNLSPISTASRELYAKVRAKFSGNLDENGPDIIMYMMALDSVFSYIGYLKRIYRSLNTFSPLNTMFPDGVLRCMGITEAESLAMRKDKTRFWGLINDLIHQATKFTCPDVMDIFNRHYWMSSNVYGDAASPKAQFYVFNQRAWYEFKETTSTGGSLEMQEGPTEHTVDAYYQFGYNLISKLSASDDAYTINGHLMRAFEGTSNFVISTLNEDELLDSVYVPEVLMQIHNIRSLSSAYNPDDWVITQDPTTNAIIHKPTMKFYNTTTDMLRAVFPIEESTLLLDINNDNPSVADVTIASRLAPVVGKRVEDASENAFYVHGGTEIVLTMSIFVFDPSTKAMSGRGVNTIMACPTGTDNVKVFIRNISAVTAFDWHPVFYLGSVPAGGDTTIDLYPFGDIFNPTPVSGDVLKDLHRVCVLSEFNAYGI